MKEWQGVAVGTSEYANKTLPAVLRTAAGLEPYTGPWGKPEAAHLLRRTMFGATAADIATVLQQPPAGAIDLLLSGPSGDPGTPLTIDSRDVVAVGTTWVDAIAKDPNSTFSPAGLRRTSFKDWWTGLMVNQALSLREKMVLFWHNHFVTELNVVSEPRFAYRYVNLLRQHALGNFKDLARAITLDGAMLRYLNGNSSTKSSPNENYARELQELFTIGKGPETAPGDYTNYSEADVKAGARVLTGWRDLTNPDTTIGPTTSYFTASRHDTANKQFSADYGNTVIAGSTDGLAEVNALLDMIFAQPETARFLCRKLYRWFVYYVIDETTEANVIAPMADILRNSGYNVSSALVALLGSAHFFDPVNRGCMIKSPLDHVIGLCRSFGVAIPSTPLATQYAIWGFLQSQASTMDMNLGDPPNVAGWSAYYQSPEFNELWINSDTLPKRSKFSDTMARSGYTVSSAKLVIDPIVFVTTLSDPNDPNAIVGDASDLLFASPITDGQKAFLKGILLPGLPDYEWSVEWGAYQADPTNTQSIAAVKSKLQALFSFMMEMPEFQLA